MPQAVYVRLYEEDADFIKEYSKKRKMEKSKIIKNFLHDTIQQKKVEQAVELYKEGIKTIQEGAELAGMEYREFFNELAKQNLLGPSAEDQEKMIEETSSLK